MNAERPDDHQLFAVVLATAHQASQDAREIQDRAVEACQRAAQTVAAIRAKQEQRYARRPNRTEDASGG